LNYLIRGLSYKRSVACKGDILYFCIKEVTCSAAVICGIGGIQVSTGGIEFAETAEGKSESE
jgi:hypothetical protein